MDDMKTHDSMNSTLLALALAAGLWAAPAFAAETAPAAEIRAAAPDTRAMEKDLQQLPWKAFRSVIEAVPKMKTDVEAYGPMGWKFVEANYRNHAWKKNIDKLDEPQKKLLADLIRRAKGIR
ncbi:MAG: hypothetical protein Q7U97_16075 [Rhodocyclaceae bacterium]|nr:hypothetical protein [Rhodocyclaceae bacterium]